MTKIKLQSIALQNFKGTRYLLLNINGSDTDISGANGSGKTTVYKAYYWCLTGKTLEPNEVVQTLNVYNEVIHKIDTSVRVTLMVDDSYEVALERKLVEKWKALGRPDEELKGTEQQRFWNDVPLTQKEFDAKLNTICDMEKWLLLSDITKFMSLKQDDRRKILLGLAGDVDESELMKPFPELVQAVASKKTIDELKIQTLSTKKRSNEELKTIPSQINAQDKLKSDENFAELRKEKDALDAQIADLDKVMQGSTEELSTVKEYNERVTKAEKALQDYKKEWNTKRDTDADNLCKRMFEAQKALRTQQETATKHKLDNDARIRQKVELQEQFIALRDNWNKENASEFSFDNTDACPYCGHLFTEEEKTKNKAQAVSVFNIHKAATLKDIQQQAELKNQQIIVLTGSINEYDKVIRVEDENALKALETALKQRQQEYDEVKKLIIENDARYNTLKNDYETAVAARPATHNEEKEANEAKKRELWSKRDALIEKLAGEQTNQRIAEENIRLGKRSQELVQIISDCDKVLWEISEYRKSKVDALESKVNSFFSHAKWKFYEKNVSNDDLQEVCICHHRGIDYNSTNGADRINLGVDIVAGLSKAYELYAPLFVDNVESVNTLIPTESQQIRLRVTDTEFKMETV